MPSYQLPTSLFYPPPSSFNDPIRDTTLHQLHGRSPAYSQDKKKQSYYMMSC